MKKFEFMLIPSHSGLLKIYIYGFSKDNRRGKVYAILNDSVASSTGYNRKTTIVKAVDKLYQSIVSQE